MRVHVLCLQFFLPVNISVFSSVCSVLSIYSVFISSIKYFGIQFISLCLQPLFLVSFSYFIITWLSSSFIYVPINCVPIISSSDFLGLQCFPSDCRFSSFFTSGTSSYTAAPDMSSLSFAGFSL